MAMLIHVATLVLAFASLLSLLALLVAHISLSLVAKAEDSEVPILHHREDSH